MNTDSITPAKLTEWKAACEALPVERTYKADLKFANIAREAMPRLIERVEELEKRLESAWRNEITTPETPNDA